MTLKKIMKQRKIMKHQNIQYILFLFTKEFHLWKVILIIINLDLSQLLTTLREIHLDIIRYFQIGTSD